MSSPRSPLRSPLTPRDTPYSPYSPSRTAELTHYGGWMEVFEDLGRTFVRDLRVQKVYKVQSEAELGTLVDKFTYTREMPVGETYPQRRAFVYNMLCKLALLLHGHTASAVGLQQALERLQRTSYGHVDTSEVMLLVLRWAPSLTLLERRQLTQYVQASPAALAAPSRLLRAEVSLWDTFHALRLTLMDVLTDGAGDVVYKSPYRSPQAPTTFAEDLALARYEAEPYYWPYAKDDEILDRPYASWRARYDTPTRWRYWRSKYDPYYDPLTDPLALDYRRDALLPPPPRVPADWSWQLDEVTWAGRRLLLDAATGLVYEEANPGAMLWSVGRLALGQLEDMDVMQQWSFVTTLSKRLHDQHTQVLDFFSAWGVSTASGSLVLHPQALRRLLRFLMPDLSLAECAALQAVVDSDANGHVGRTELISAADDLTATLQMPKSWMHNGLRSTLHRLAAHIGHSRRTAAATFDRLDADMDGALRPHEVMPFVKALSPMLPASERRRIAVYAYSFGVVADSRRVTQVDMMKALQLVHLRVLPRRTWPSVITSHSRTSPLKLTAAPYASSPPPPASSAYAPYPRRAYTPPPRLAPPTPRSPHYTSVYSPTSRTPLVHAPYTTPSKKLAFASTPATTSFSAFSPPATPPPTVGAADSGSFGTPVDMMVASARKDVDRAERSVVKLHDAEKLLKEAVDLYKAANDAGRQRAAESNLLKVGELLREARVDKVDKESSLNMLRSEQSRLRFGTP